MSWWQDGKKKKKDKKKKEKKEKQESEASAEGPAEPDQVEVWQESFETMPSVGTWLMSFTEEDLLRPTTVDAGLIWTFQTGPKRINGVDTG
ncbi:unnamed protein product [Durusdinium trenchii]|uniref:Uncharacterized protein n=1 Tax=Durusdinium trenchii TaxID=1381693 RepID=A0ABP0JK11_9DINO